MSEENKALADRFHMDIFREGNLDAAGEGQRGPVATKQVASAVIAAFPDRHITHEDTIAEGDKVLIRWTMSGTQEGELMAIPPTDWRVTVTGFDLFCIEGGKIVEMWQEADQLGMMQQLGVILEP